MKKSAISILIALIFVFAFTVSLLAVDGSNIYDYRNPKYKESPGTDGDPWDPYTHDHSSVESSASSDKDYNKHCYDEKDDSTNNSNFFTDIMNSILALFKDKNSSDSLDREQNDRSPRKDKSSKFLFK